MTEANDFYKEIDNERRAILFSRDHRYRVRARKKIFLDLFLYTHGIAVLTVTKKLTFNRNTAEKMVMNTLSALIRQEKT